MSKNTASNKPRVLLIGSCRISNSIKAIREIFQLQPIDYYGYVHSTAEIIQLIRCIRRELEIPKYLWSYTSRRPPVIINDFTVEMALVEISSICYAVFDGYVLQFNCLKGAFVDFPQLWQIWRKNANANRLETRLAELATTESFAKIDAHRRAILERAVMQVQTIEMIRSDLRVLREFLPENFIVVTHCSHGPDHPSMTSRNQSIETITNACMAENIRYFDPSPYAAAFGLDHAFENEARDLHHFTATFSMHLGTIFADQLGISRHVQLPKSPKMVVVEQLKKISVEENSQTALSLAQKLLSLSPFTKIAWETKAKVHAHNKEWQSAEECWNWLIDNNPNNIEYLTKAAYAALQSGHPSRALKLLDKSKILNNGKSANPELSALICLRLGDHDGAIAELTAIIKNNLTYGLTLIERAETPWLAAAACRAVAAEHGNNVIREARSHLCNQAIRQAIGSAITNIGSEIENLRLAQFAAGGDTNALIRVRSIISANISNAASCAMRLKSKIQVTRLAALLKLDPAFEDFSIATAELLAQQEDHTQASELLTTILNSKNQDLRAEALHAAMQKSREALKQKDISAAQTYINLLHHHVPKNADVRRLVISLKKRLMRELHENPSEDKAHKLLALDPQNIKALRVVCFSATTALDTRQAYLQTLLKRDPAVVHELGTHFAIALKKKQTDMAQCYYLALFSLNQRDDRITQWRELLIKTLFVDIKKAISMDPARVPATADAILMLDASNIPALRLATQVLVKRHAWHKALPYADRLLELVPDNPKIQKLAARCKKYTQINI